MAGQFDYLFPEDSASSPELGVGTNVSQGGIFDHLFDDLPQAAPQTAPPEVVPEVVPEAEPTFYPEEIAPVDAAIDRIVAEPEYQQPVTPGQSYDSVETVPSELQSATGWTKPQQFADPSTLIPQYQKPVPILDSLGDALQSGYLRTEANVKNWLADLDEQRRDSPFQHLAEIAAAVAGKASPPRPLSNADRKRLRFEAGQSYNESIKIGRPLSFEEVSDWKDFRNYLKGLIGSSAPQMLGSIMSMGTFSPLLLSAEMNEGMKDIEGLSLDKRIGLVKAGGLIAAGLENIGLGVMIRGVPKEVLAKLGINKIAGFFERSLLGRIAARTAATSSTEATTEALQDGTFIAGEWLAGKKFQPGEITSRLKEAGIGGGLLGGGLGGGGKAVTEVTGKLGDILPNTGFSLEDSGKEDDGLSSPNAEWLRQKAIENKETLEELPKKPSEIAEEKFTKKIVEATPDPEVDEVVDAFIDLTTGIKGEKEEVKKPLGIRKKGGDPVVESEVKIEEEVAPEPQPEVVSTPQPEAVSPEVQESTETTPTEVQPEVEPEVQTEVAEDLPPKVQDGTETDTEEGTTPAVVPEKVIAKPEPKEVVKEEAQTIKAKKLVSEGEPGFKRKAIQGTNATVVTPDGSMEVGRNLVLVDLSEVVFARGRLQGRDRGRQQSEDTSRSRAVNFDPAQVLESRVSDSGAPLVTPSGVILSGNGRTLTITELYDNPDLSKQKESYLAELRKFGDIEGIERPILVQRIKTEEWGKIEKQQYEQAVKFADASNVSKVDTMSSFERSVKDAKILKPFANLMKSPNINTGVNSDFIQKFAEKAVPETERGDFFASNGTDLSTAGIRRIEDAVLVAGYGENETVLAALESPKSEIKSLKNGMMKAAPRFAEIVGKIDKGDIPADMDIAPFIVDAVERVRKLKQDRTNLAEDKAQESLLVQEEVELTDSIVDAVYKEDGSTTRSQEFIGKLLNEIADNILGQDYTQGIPGLEDIAATAPIEDIVAKSIKKVNAEQKVKDDKAKEGKKQGELAAPEPDSETVTSKDSGRREPKRKSFESREAPDGKATLTATKGISSSVREQIYVDLAEADEGMSDTLSLKEKISIYKNMPPMQLAKRMQKIAKEKFGLKFVESNELRPESVEMTINNMMNFYQNGQGMAAVLGMPLEFIGLDGTLGLSGILGGMKRAGAWYNPAYAPDENHPVYPYITIKARNAAFAHEWGHALDFHILEQLGNGWHDGMSGRLRGKNSGDAWDNVNFEGDSAKIRFKNTFAELLNSLFYEDGADAAAIMDLQTRIAKARSQKSIDKHQEQIDRIKEGITKKRFSKSKFKLGAEKLGGKYWNEPTELFARAFEAYVAHKVTEQSITPNMPGTEFLGKPDSGYIYTKKDVNSFSGIELAYPQESERLNIFSKFDDLFYAMADVFYTEEAAKNEPGRIIEHASLFKRDEKTLTSKEGWKAANQRVKQRGEQWRNIQNKRAKRIRKYKDKSVLMNSVYALESVFRFGFLGSKQGNLESYQKRYPKINEITKIMNLLFSDPGGERYTSSTWNDKVPINIRRFAHMLNKISKKHKADLFTEEDERTLRLFGTSDPATLAKAKKGEVSKNILEFADDMKNLLNKLWDYANNNNVEMNFLERNSYLPRIMDLVLVQGDLAKFKKQATALYEEVIWVNEYGEIDMVSSSQLMDIGKIAGSKDFRGIDEDVDALASLYRQVKDIEKEIKRLDDSSEPGDADRAAKLEDQVEEIMAENEEVYTEGYNALANLWSQKAAEDWKTRLLVKAGEDPSNSSPVAAQFIKKRKLPPEADTYMVDFYLTPLDAIQSYVTRLVRKVEYERLFGRHKIDTGKKRKPKSMELRDYKDFLFDEMADKGVHENDIHMMRYDVDSILGRNQPLDSGAMKTINTFHSFALMAMLSRAVATSLPEPFVAGVKMGSAKKGFEVFIETLDELYGKFNKDAAQRTQMKKQIGAILGIYDDPEIGEMMAERMGGHLADDPRNQERMNTYFVRTALQGVTNAQRRATMWIGTKYLRELGDQYLNPVGMSEEAIAKNKKAAEMELMDLGIPKKQLEEFASYMQETVLVPEGLMQSDGELTPNGELLSIASLRLVDRTIQDPAISSRPRYAEHPLGRLVFSIQSFNYSFTRNVLVSEFKKFQRTNKNLGTGKVVDHAARLMPAIFQLYMGHLLVSSARMMLLDREKWEEKKEDGSLFNYLLEISFNRSGALGIIEPWYQSWRAVRYQRDLASSMVGATTGFYLQPFQKIAKFFNDETNSPNTTNAEKKALEAFYTLVITPMIVAAVSNPSFLSNLGVGGNIAAGALAMVGNSKTAKTTFSKGLIDIFDSK